MRKIDDGGLAFPGYRNQQVGTVADHGFDDDTPTFADVHYPGMSLRDYVAVKAFIFFLADEDSTYSHDARRAFHAADAFIAQRSEGSS